MKNLLFIKAVYINGRSSPWTTISEYCHVIILSLKIILKLIYLWNIFIAKVRLNPIFSKKIHIIHCFHLLVYGNVFGSYCNWINCNNKIENSETSREIRRFHIVQFRNNDNYFPRLYSSGTDQCKTVPIHTDYPRKSFITNNNFSQENNVEKRNLLENKN